MNCIGVCLQVMFIGMSGRRVSQKLVLITHKRGLNSVLSLLYATDLVDFTKQSTVCWNIMLPIGGFLGYPNNCQ